MDGFVWRVLLVILLAFQSSLLLDFRCYWNLSIRSLRIEHTWNGTLLEEREAVDLQIQARSGTGLIVKVTAPFYDDVPPSNPSGWPYSSLSSYEVVHLFLHSDNNNRYTEIELGPWAFFIIVIDYLCHWTNNLCLLAGGVITWLSFG